MALVEICNVSFAYDVKSVIENVTLTVDTGEIISLLGPSGCGKSTLLRLIAGLETPNTGFIKTRGIKAGTNRNVLRLLFQDYDAYPWYTVWKNIQLGSGPKPYPSKEMVEKILKQVGLDNESNRYPGELSGGMRKRLGLARCMVSRPSLLLLDEPFSSLDIDTKYSMYDLVQKLWQETKCAVIMVTHDLHEAILLSDRILVSSPRPFRVRQVINIPFTRPRSSIIDNGKDYLNIRRSLIEYLRLSSTHPVDR
jgi:NitT/TauT family transport system ATP-binding protein